MTESRRYPRQTIARPITPALQRSRTGTLVAASIAALAAAALYNTYRARKVEQQHPPTGRFLEIDGIRLHYLERGAGSPVVLIHGNIVTAEDYVLSGVFDRVAERHRVLAIDRPGFGYSDRPHGTMWTAEAQADLLRHAFTHLGLERPIIVGHSWGTLVALALALNHPDAVSGLVLLSGYYYYPSLGVDVALFSPPAIPVLGGVLRYTVAPLLGTAIMPLLVKAMFAPLPVPEHFTTGFAQGLSIRPWQIRAEAQDTASMIPTVTELRDRLTSLHLPVVIIAGTDDRVVDVGQHALRLYDEIPHSDLHLVSGAGHMVHYAAPDQVADAIEAVSDVILVPRKAEPASHFQASAKE